MIEIYGDEQGLKEALISLAHQLLYCKLPTWYEISEDDIISLLREEPGLYVFKSYKKDS